jgi:uncharacterized protein YecE (DUF72 family)
VARYFIGSSGWVYPHWRGTFYPQKLPQAQWLQYYAEHFPTVELNNSFYRLPSEQAFQGWRHKAPDGFRYSVKASRYITHIKRLKSVAEPVETFLSRARHLDDKLGPLLFQLPPGLHRDDERLESFLSMLPRRFRYVIEFRHESWLDDGIFDILHRYNVGLCVFDMPGLACPLLATADFAYVRFHGAGELYSNCYSDEELDQWAVKIAGLAKGKDEVYIYFNNDIEGFAIENAKTLTRKLNEL